MQLITQDDQAIIDETGPTGPPSIVQKLRLMPRRHRYAAVGIVTLAAIILLAGAFPIGLAKPWIAQRLSDRLGVPVSIGSVSRAPFFSFSPTIILRDIRAPQASWAGKGDMLRAGEVRLRVPLLALLKGEALKPDGIAANDIAVALVRDGAGQANWPRRKGGSGFALSDLSITNGRFTLLDARRHLDIAGRFEATPQKGLLAEARGRFHDAPVTVSLIGSPVVGAAHDQAYPFRLAMVSPLLDFRAQGRSVGALNMADMALEIQARAPSLKYLDDVIQAGLFGTQPIDLRARVRRKERDWFVDGLSGSVGRSQLVGQASILKRDGRSKIDATITFSALDFDDLADDEGKAAQAALRARIGERVLPNTRINLSKVGKTDGTIRFAARRLLFNEPSAFRSLSGVLTLDGKLLKIEDINAALTAGRMTGRMLVDHREGRAPRLDVDLQFRDGNLAGLLNSQGLVDGPFGARVTLSGRGDTIREALSRAQGSAGFVVGNGTVSRKVAAIFAQDMGKAIGAVIGGGDQTVPLRCIALGFEARDGVLKASPFLIETAATRSRGEGTITLDGEQIALTIGGTARDPSGLPLIDPIQVKGTLSKPSVELGQVGKGFGGMVGALVKSIGGALGLAEKKGPEVVARGPVDCQAIAHNLLTPRR